MLQNTVDQTIVEDLTALLGEDRVLTGRAQRVVRARVPAPFPVHRWSEYCADVVVLPRTTEEVVAIVKLANRARIPIVARAGGSGLADGAVPLRKGILMDVKLMNRVLEVDPINLTATVQPGINMLKLNELYLHKYGLHYPDNPASYPISMIGGRIGTSGWSLIGGRYGHVRDLVLSLTVVLPTGEVVTLGEGGGRKIRKASIGYNLKQLFIGSMGTLGIVTEATIDLIPKPELEASLFYGFPGFDDAYHALGQVTGTGLATIAAGVLFDEEKLAYLRRDDEAYIGKPEDLRAMCAVAFYGARVEVEPAARRIQAILEEAGGNYLGDQISQGDWAARHDRYALPLHGRTKQGQVTVMSWHCEDAAILYSEVPAVRRKWHEIATRYIADYDFLDDWGLYALTNGAFRGGSRDVLLELDIGIDERKLNDENWATWVRMKGEIAQAAIDHGGSISACHGGTREGDAELVPIELGPEAWELTKLIKRTLDPNNIMNPGKFRLDEAYEEA